MTSRKILVHLQHDDVFYNCVDDDCDDIIQADDDYTKIKHLLVLFEQNQHNDANGMMALKTGRRLRNPIIITRTIFKKSNVVAAANEDSAETSLLQFLLLS